MPRVTEVNSYFEEPFLVKWKLRMALTDPVQITEYGDALVIGTIVDKMAQIDINGGDYSTYEYPKKYAEGVKNSMVGWEKFKVSKKPEEQDLLKRMYEYKANMQKELVLGDLVGHPDFILGVDGTSVEVCDLKTSKQVSKSHWIQVSQYLYMVNQLNFGSETMQANGLKNARISILRLDKATPGLYEYKVLEEPFISFWQGKFQARLEAFNEDREFGEMMRKKLEEECL